MPIKSSKYYVVKLGKGYWYGVTDDYTSLEKSKKFHIDYWSKERVQEIMENKLGYFNIPYDIQLLKITHEIIGTE